MGLGLWVWVHESKFVDHRLDRRGHRLDRYGSHRRGSLIIVVVIGIVVASDWWWIGLLG